MQADAVSSAVQVSHGRDWPSEPVWQIAGFAARQVSNASDGLARASFPLAMDGAVRGRRYRRLPTLGPCGHWTIQLMNVKEVRNCSCTHSGHGYTNDLWYWGPAMQPGRRITHIAESGVRGTLPWEGGTPVPHRPACNPWQATFRATAPRGLAPWPTPPHRHRGSGIKVSDIASRYRITTGSRNPPCRPRSS